MNASRLLGIWGIFLILWATLYAYVFALAPSEMAFGDLVSDILALPVLLLIVGGTIVRIIRGLRLWSAPHRILPKEQSKWRILYMMRL